MEQQEMKRELKSEFLKRVNEMAQELVPMVKDNDERAVVIVASDGKDYEPYEDGTRPSNTSMAALGKGSNLMATLACAMKDEDVGHLFDVARLLTGKGDLMSCAEILKAKMEGISAVEDKMGECCLDTRRKQLTAYNVLLMLASVWTVMLVGFKELGICTWEELVSNLFVMAFAYILCLWNIRLTKREIKTLEAAHKEEPRQEP